MNSPLVCTAARRALVLATISLSACALLDGSAIAQSAEGIRIRYELAEPGQVSAAVYDETGRLIRELRRGQQQAAGIHEITWDGIDANGEAAPPGAYEWRVLRTPGFLARYVTTVGVNPGSAPWHEWVGNHGGPASVAIDDTGLYVAAASTETAPVLIKQSREGTIRHWRRWRSDVTRGRGQGGLSLASDGRGTLYMLQQNGMINLIDADRGELRGQWDILPRDQWDAEGRRPTGRIYAHGDKVADIDMDARGQTIVLSFRKRNEVRWLDPEDGSVTATVSVPEPRGIAVTPGGDEALVISEGRVLALTPEGVARTVIDGDIEHAHRLTIDAQSGAVLVATEAPANQIKRYSVAGQLLATYGREGGRLAGVYKPADFLGVTDITSDDRGGFLVAEERVGPRRVAHFDADGGLVNEWYGGQTYYAWGEPDSRDPSKVWFNSRRDLVLAEVNYETGAWRILECYRPDELGDGLVTAYIQGSGAGRWRVVYHDDVCYLVSEQRAQVLRHRPGSLTPVSVISGKKGPTLPLERALEIAGHPDAHKNAKAFRWLDTDGDGHPQPTELEFIDTKDVPMPRWVDDELNLIAGGDAQTADGKKAFGVWHTSPIQRQGVLTYPIGDEPDVERRVADVPIAWHIGASRRAVFRSTAGDYYASYRSRAELHGDSWPTPYGGGRPTRQVERSRGSAVVGRTTCDPRRIDCLPGHHPARSVASANGHHRPNRSDRHSRGPRGNTGDGMDDRWPLRRQLSRSPS